MKKFLWPFVAVAVVLSLVVILWHRDYQLENELQDENPAIRAAAIRRLNRENHLQLLMNGLKDQSPDVRLLAVQRLGGLGPQGAERATALILLLKDVNAGVRREAAWSLGLIGPDAWPALRDALNDENPLVRAGAALALNDAYQHKNPDPWPSRESKAIIPILSELLNDTNQKVKQTANLALETVLRHSPSLER